VKRLVIELIEENQRKIEEENLQFKMNRGKLK